MESAANRSEFQTMAGPIDGAVTRPVAKPSKIRSAVTNGARSFILGDGNSSWYRRFKDIVELHISDLGGHQGLSEALLSLVRRAATLEVELERLEGQLSLGAEIDLDAYSRVTNTLRRTLESIGLKRVAREVESPLVKHFCRRPPGRPTA
jgi:hypothetical protein